MDISNYILFVTQYPHILIQQVWTMDFSGTYEALFPLHRHFEEFS